MFGDFTRGNCSSIQGCPRIQNHSKDYIFDHDFAVHYLLIKITRATKCKDHGYFQPVLNFFTLSFRVSAECLLISLSNPAPLFICANDD